MLIVAFERRGARRAVRRGELHDAFRGLEDLDLAPPPGCRVGALVAPLGDRGGASFDLIDLHRALALELATEDVGAPEAEAESLLPGEPMAFLRHFAGALRTARRAEGFVRKLVRRFPAAELAEVGVLERAASVRLRAPVPRPGKIFGVAARGPGSAPEPFLKAAGSAVGPGDAIVLPRGTREVLCEGALACVIGARGREATRESALELVAGYTVACDVRSRDFEGRPISGSLGRSFDTFSPLGPALVTRDDVPDPDDLALATRVSGKALRAVRTKELRFPVVELVRLASRIATLEPGDVLLLEPAAEGPQGEAPAPRLLRDGDRVEVEIERLGLLHNPVRRLG